MDKQIKTLSREEYRLYLSQRKPLDRDFTKLTINKYEENRKNHDEKMETRKLEHKQKMETDEAYRNAYKEKTRKAYEKAKQRRLENQKRSPTPEIKQEPIRVEPIQPVQTIEVREPRVPIESGESIIDYSDLLYDF